MASYASRVAIRRACDAARENGIEPGALEISPDGRIKVTGKQLVPTEGRAENLYDRMKREGKL